MKLNKIYNEDCLVTLERMPDNFIDLVVTSPPYDNLRDYKGHAWNDMIWQNVLALLYDKLRPGGVIVWVVGDAVINGSESGTSFKQALYAKDECGFRLHDTMIYQKTNFSFPSKLRYHQIFEYMFIFTKGKPKTFNAIKDRKNKYNQSWGKNTHRQKDGSLVEVAKSKYGEYGMRMNIWRINCAGGFGQQDRRAYRHPATFPESLARDHIVTWSNPGDTIYDPFSGSGTTLRMAKELDRNYIGSEIATEYSKLSEELLTCEK